MATLFSLVIVLFLYFFPFSLEGIQGFNWIALALIIVPIPLLISEILIIAFAWIPLQKAEKNMTPRIMETFSNDKNFKLTHLLMAAFLFLSYFFALDILFLKKIEPNALIMIWTLALGITIDMKVHSMHRIMQFLDPFHVLDMYTQHAKTSVPNFHELELCKWIDAISEITIKAIERNSTTLAVEGMNSLGEIIKVFLESEKSIAHRDEGESKEVGGADPISYTLFFMFQKLEMINEKALEGRLEPLCSDLMALLGKIAIYSSQFDISLVAFPVHYMGKFVQLAQEHKMQEVADRTTLTLLEVGKVIVQDKNLQYLEIRDVFLSIIHYMHEIAKETFRQDKTTNIKMLLLPFIQLKALFAAEPVSSHRDAQVIIQNVKNVIEEFSALESVMQTMPPSSTKTQLG